MVRGVASAGIPAAVHQALIEIVGTIGVVNLIEFAADACEVDADSEGDVVTGNVTRAEALEHAAEQLRSMADALAEVESR